MAPLTKVLKVKRFEWNEKAQTTLKEIKSKLILNFSKVFKVKCDASGVGIRVVYPKKTNFL